jgi:hypothetical protein
MGRSKRSLKVKENWEAEREAAPVYLYEIGIPSGSEIVVMEVEAEEARSDCDELTFYRNTKKSEETVAAFRNWSYYKMIKTLKRENLLPKDFGEIV